jgi:Type III pantothenate kinase
MADVVPEEGDRWMARYCICFVYIYTVQAINLLSLQTPYSGYLARLSTNSSLSLLLSTQIRMLLCVHRCPTIQRVPSGPESDVISGASEYPTLGTDRALALRGAGKQWGYPVMVVDCGTAMTFRCAVAARMCYDRALCSTNCLSASLLQ